MFGDGGLFPDFGRRLRTGHVWHFGLLLGLVVSCSWLAENQNVALRYDHVDFNA